MKLRHITYYFIVIILFTSVFSNNVNANSVIYKRQIVEKAQVTLHTSVEEKTELIVDDITLGKFYNKIIQFNYLAAQFKLGTDVDPRIYSRFSRVICRHQI